MFYWCLFQRYSSTLLIKPSIIHRQWNSRSVTMDLQCTAKTFWLSKISPISLGTRQSRLISFEYQKRFLHLHSHQWLKAKSRLNTTWVLSEKYYLNYTSNYPQDNLPPIFKNELIIEREASLQLRPSLEALRREAQDLEAQIRQLQVKWWCCLMTTSVSESLKRLQTENSLSTLSILFIGLIFHLRVVTSEQLLSITVQFHSSLSNDNYFRIP